MSETAPQSLASVIDQQAPPEAGTSSPAPQKMPSLEAIIASPPANASADPSVSGDASPPSRLSADASPVQQTPSTAGQVASAAEQSRLRALLTQRGFEIAETYATDDAIADLIAQQIDAANATQEPEGYQDFLKWKAQQTAQSAQSAVQQSPATPAAPAAPQVSPSEVLSAVSSGFVTYDPAAKKWVATHPTFNAHAEAMISQEEKQRQIKISLATDPEGFIAQQVEARVKAALESLQTQQPTSEIKEVLATLKQQQVQAQTAQIESWATTNASKLYDAAGNQTPYYGFYQTLYTDLTKADPSFDQRPLERHNEIVRRMTAAEQAFRSVQPAAPAVPAPAPVPQKPQSFMQGVANRNGHNRLSDYSGPARNPVAPQIPKGAGGAPSLNGIISSMTSIGQ